MNSRESRQQRREREQRIQLERLTDDEKAAIIERAGNRTIEFYFERVSRDSAFSRLVCTRARIHADPR